MRYPERVATDRRRIRQALLDLAALQQGYFTARQARDQGFSHQSQKYHVDHGDWERVDHGLFRLRNWPTSNDDHLVRWHLWSGGSAVVSHDTALALHGLGDVNPARVHLTVPPGFRKRSDSVVLHRQDVPDDDVQWQEGYRVTRPTRAIAESAADGLGQELVTGSVADMLDKGLATRRRLRETAARLGTEQQIDEALGELGR